ncbi:MAG TPA: tetratricopeptide repeat protein, partial [Burkholderiaceae bacterium]
LNAYLKQDAAGMAFLQAPPRQHGVPAHMLTMARSKAQGTPPTRAGFAAEVARRGFGDALAIYREMQQRDPAFKLEAGDLNVWGYQWLRDERDARAAIGMFTLGTQLYPHDGNLYDSLAEAYEAAGDRAQAIHHYDKALSLDPANGNAAARLKVLRASAN